MPDTTLPETAHAKGLARLLPPPPLFAIQPPLTRVVTRVAARRPELFARLGPSVSKRFLIDPQGLPMVLLLEPDPAKPRLTACRRGEPVAHDVVIRGSFRTLLRMIDRQTDSDALFFNRALTIAGDTEASVALRNALDDMDGTLAGDVAAAFGPLSGAVARTCRCHHAERCTMIAGEMFKPELVCPDRGRRGDRRGPRHWRPI